MIKQYLLGFQHIQFTSFALVLFMTVFLGALAWVFRVKNRRLYDSLAEMPLRDATSNQEGLQS